MDESTRKWFSAWVRFSFRDIADRDYLAARLLNQKKLFQASAWSALQALEKYLKGIILFSYRSVKGYKHDLPKLWHSVEKLPRLNANLPTDCTEFLQHLSFQGANRYLDYPLHFEGDEIINLDKCVWHLRRYCQDFLLLPGDRKRYSNDSQKRLDGIPQKATPEVIKSFRIADGYLESILDDMSKPLRTVLVWKNFYYGKYKKHKIHLAEVISWERPLQIMHPELLAAIEPVAYIPNEILEEWRRSRNEQTVQRAG